MAVIPVFEVNDLCYEYDNQIPALDIVRPFDGQVGRTAGYPGFERLREEHTAQDIGWAVLPARGSVLAFGNPLTEQAFQEDAFKICVPQAGKPGLPGQRCAVVHAIRHG